MILRIAISCKIRISAKDKLTQIAQAFCNRMEAVGFKSGIYANLNWLNNYLNSPSLSGYDHWVAQYNWRCDYAGSYSFWQYSSSGNVPGVNGRCDMNYCFNGSLLNVDDSKMHIQYEAHVSNIGWMSSKRDGSTAGTTGQSKSVEDLKVSILNPVEDGSVQINANVSGVGWQGWDTPSASEGGTTGQGRAVEAVRLRLTGSLARTTTSTTACTPPTSAGWPGPRTARRPAPPASAGASRPSRSGSSRRATPPLVRQGPTSTTPSRRSPCP